MLAHVVCISISRDSRSRNEPGPATVQPARSPATCRIACLGQDTPAAELRGLAAGGCANDEQQWDERGDRGCSPQPCVCCVLFELFGASSASCPSVQMIACLLPAGIYKMARPGPPQTAVSPAPSSPRIPRRRCPFQPPLSAFPIESTRKAEPLEPATLWAGACSTPQIQRSDPSILALAGPTPLNILTSHRRHSLFPPHSGILMQGKAIIL
jgi:hypothetical protein